MGRCNIAGGTQSRKQQNPPQTSWIPGGMAGLS